MAKTNKARIERSEKILEYLCENPLATDEVLANRFNVSVNTIRLDRARLGIKEFKERLKDKANNAMKMVTSMPQMEFICNMVNFNKNESVVSRIETDKSMAFDNTDIVKGQYVYSFAETVAMSLLPITEAIIEVANIKYVEKIVAGAVLFAKAELKRKTDTGYLIWVRIVDEKENLKFKAKFILKGIN